MVSAVNEQLTERQSKERGRYETTTAEERRADRFVYAYL